MVSKIVIEHLSKGYPLSRGTFFPVLSNINFQIKSGEFVSIIGPSGVGKSTLFHILSGISDPDSGTIRIGGKEATMRRGQFGYMFQSHLLLPWKTAQENIMVGLEIKGIDRRKAREKARNLLEEFKLSQFAHFYPNALSGGMKQRIALLRTIAFNSSILLLDEPFGSLDALTRVELQQYLLTICQKLHLTVLFITHDISEAIFLSDRIFVLRSRPGTISKIIPVPWSHPRKLKDLASNKAVNIEKQLFGLLMKEERV